MAIVKMKKLRLLGLAEEKDALLKDLQLAGCVEIADAGGDLSAADTAERFRRCSSALTEHRTAAAQLTAALATLNACAPAKGKLLAPKPDVTSARLFDDKTLAEARKTADRINALSADINAAKGELGRLQTERAALEPWQTLDLPLEVSGTDTTDVLLGAMPAATPFGEAEAAAAAADEMSWLRLVSADKSAQYVVLVCHKQATEAVLAALREYSFSRVAFPDRTGTAAANIEALDASAAALDERLAADTDAIFDQADKREKLQLAADRMTLDIQRDEAEEKLYTADSVFALRGWVPAEKEAGLAGLLDRYTCAWETEDPAAEDYPDTPVKLKNNILTRGLSMVTEMYSLPAYDGVDPNPLMAPFFIVFYGLMLADMGYGILMLAGAILALAKMKPTGGTRNFCELLLYCGISTTIFGAITGGCFGDAPLQIAKILDPATTWQGLPALFTPLDDTVMILLGSVALGFIHIVTGMAISFVEKLKRGEYLDALFEEVTWWVVFAGIALMVLGKTKLVLYIGIAMVVVGPLITGEGMGKVTGIFGSLYNHVTGFFGDLLSYSRIMALMLAGSVIAQVFNTIGAIPGNLIVFLIISLVGNMLNFGLNLLGCYVHDLRLQCLEFFGKFYKDGGRPFTPLQTNPKHFNVDTVNN